MLLMRLSLHGEVEAARVKPERKLELVEHYYFYRSRQTCIVRP